MTYSKHQSYSYTLKQQGSSFGGVFAVAFSTVAFPVVLNVYKFHGAL